jgi:hypothetical protein
LLPDAGRAAYVVSVSGQYGVVVNGREGKPFDAIAAKELGPIIFDSPEEIHYLAILDGTLYLVKDRIG